MKKRIERMAYRTWEVISGDIFTVMEEQGMKAVLDRATVIECVCDADYMLTHGGDEEAYKEWSKLPTYDAKMEEIKGAFPHLKYGW